MKTSQLITYLANEIRKHGDREVVVRAYGDDECVIDNKIQVFSNDRGETIIQISVI